MNSILETLVISIIAIGMGIALFYLLVVFVIGRYIVSSFQYLKHEFREFHENDNRISIEMNENIKRQKELRKAYEEQKKQNDEVFNRFNKYN